MRWSTPREPATVVLLGFYHSVMLALAWAARHPERVDGLVLFGGAARGWASMSGPGTQALLSLIDRDWDTFVESAVHAWLGWPDAETGRLAAEWFRDATTPAIARETLREASEIDVSGLLPSVACPVLVLHRAGSSVVPLEQSSEPRRRSRTPCWRSSRVRRPACSSRSRSASPTGSPSSPSIREGAGGRRSTRTWRYEPRRAASPLASGGAGRARARAHERRDRRIAGDQRQHG